MKRLMVAFFVLLAYPAILSAIESGQFRLMSVAVSQKWILISRIEDKPTPGKPKYIIDASVAKITVDGKPAELSELTQFAIANVRFELKKSKQNGIDIDGVASEIRILTPEQPKKKAMHQSPSGRSH